MELSTYALIIGILEVLFAVPMLFHPKETAKWLHEFMHDDVGTRLVGAVLVVLSVLALSHGYTIDTTPPGLVRLLAWIIMVKWLMITWMPQSMIATAEKYLKNEHVALLGGVTALCLGLLLIVASKLV